MAPRAMWTGQLRLSLVSFGVRLYAATESSQRVAMNQLHKDCHQRLKNQTVCPQHGPVGRDEIEKGYEYEKDSYVIIGQEDLEAIKLPSGKTIELVQFVEPSEIDPRYINSPYFIGPDGPVAEEAFAVIREAMKRTNKVGIGKFVMHSREHIVALMVSGKGFLLTTLRYAAEVRDGTQFFGDLKEGDLDEEQVKLATSILQGKVGKFKPAEFKDKYRDAFFEVVKAKIEGEDPIVMEDDEPVSTFNFMDALKESVAQAGRGETPSRKKNGKKKATKVAKKPAAKSVAGGKKKSQKRA